MEKIYSSTYFAITCLGFKIPRRRQTSLKTHPFRLLNFKMNVSVKTYKSSFTHHITILCTREKINTWCANTSEICNYVWTSFQCYFPRANTLASNVHISLLINTTLNTKCQASQFTPKRI